MIPVEAVMSERDELADLLADAIYRYTGVSTSSSKEMADELLSEGYAKESCCCGVCGL